MVKKKNIQKKITIKKKQLKKKTKKTKLRIFLHITWITLLIIILIPITILALREILPSEIDDVSAEINCTHEVLIKSDVLWVIPSYKNKTLDKQWCGEILKMDKALGMHGIYHTYNEFYFSISEEELLEGMDSFKDCFGFYPTRFKPPQLNISEENAKLVKKYMELEGELNQLFHKVYHCDDTGIIKNEVVRWF